MDRVEINGVDYTNKWSNVMPAAIGGKWYIYYKGSYPWSHFEAPAAKSVVANELPVNMEIYPNPFTRFINIKFNGHRVHTIELYNPMGQLLDSWNVNREMSDQITVSINYPGSVFILKIAGDNGVTTRAIIRQ